MRGVKTRGDGFQWLVDDAIPEMGNEDWIDRYLIVPLGGTFIDCGVFVGVHSVKVARRHGARVIGFEPCPTWLPILKENLVLNGVADQVTICEKALSDKPGEARFRPSTMSFAADGELVVPVTTLDEALVSIDRLDLIKIDVEGHEAAVLQGARAVCHRFRPRIVVEVHGMFPGCEHNGNLIGSWCDELAYRHHRIFDNGNGHFYLELNPR